MSYDGKIYLQEEVSSLDYYWKAKQNMATTIKPWEAFICGLDI